MKGAHMYDLEKGKLVRTIYRVFRNDDGSVRVLWRIAWNGKKDEWLFGYGFFAHEGTGWRWYPEDSKKIYGMAWTLSGMGGADDNSEPISKADALAVLAVHGVYPDSIDLGKYPSAHYPKKGERLRQKVEYNMTTESSNPTPKLPNIRLSSQEMKVVHSIIANTNVHGLATSIVGDAIELPEKLGSVTAKNIKTTLNTCSGRAREIFTLLINGWNAAGGIIQCAKPGRVYLKIKTKTHQIGRVSTLSHKFNLIVLAAPRKKVTEHIQVIQGLGNTQSEFGYLDCIPKNSMAFDSATSALPGFEKHGTINRILLDKVVTLKDVKELLKQMLILKLVEEKAP